MDDRDVIVVDGREEVVRAFVMGFLAGQGVAREAVLFGRDLPLDHASLGARLRALLPGGRHEALLLVDTRLAAALASALSEAHDLGLRLVERARLASAWFTFAADTPSREAAARIHDALAAIPSGVVLADEEREVLDPEAHGVKLYAPAHEYTFRAKGRLAGAVDGVVAMHRRLGELDFVTLEAIHIEDHVPPQPSLP